MKCVKVLSWNGLNEITLSWSIKCCACFIMNWMHLLLFINTDETLLRMIQALSISTVHSSTLLSLLLLLLLLLHCLPWPYKPDDNCWLELSSPMVAYRHAQPQHALWSAVRPQSVSQAAYVMHCCVASLQSASLLLLTPGLLVACEVCRAMLFYRCRIQRVVGTG
jgi:hypothetical protein